MPTAVCSTTCTPSWKRSRPTSPPPRTPTASLACVPLSFLYAPIQRLLGDLPIRGSAVLAVAPSAPDALALHLPHAIEILRDLDREPPWPVNGVRVDAGALAADLETALVPLDAALGALVEAELELKFAQHRANEALDYGQKVASWVSEALDGLRGLADA